MCKPAIVRTLREKEWNPFVYKLFKIALIIKEMLQWFYGLNTRPKLINN
jgi:hypothetical protein